MKEAKDQIALNSYATVNSLLDINGVCIMLEKKIPVMKTKTDVMLVVCPIMFGNNGLDSAHKYE